MIDALRQVKLEEKEKIKPVEAVITDEDITLRVEWKEEPKTEESGWQIRPIGEARKEKTGIQIRRLTGSYKSISFIVIE